MIVSFTDYNLNYAAQYRFGKFYIALFALLFIINIVFVMVRQVILFIQDRKKAKKGKRPPQTAMKGPDLFDHIGQMSSDEFDKTKKAKNEELENMSSHSISDTESAHS